MEKILVVVDMQNDFIDGALGTKEAQAILSNVTEKIKTHKGTVLFTRDTHQNSYLSTQEGQNLPVIHCVEGTEGWELQSDIRALAKEKGGAVYNKNTFGSKDLVAHLTELADREPIDEIEFIGLCTDICVISNAITTKTFLPEIKITVDASCCAGVTPKSHQNALEAMRLCQIHVIHEDGQ